MNVESLVRPEVQRFQPYVPGRPIAEVKRQYRLRRVVKLASNENPLGPSRRAIGALSRVSKELHRYPEGTSGELREALARRVGLPPSQVIVGAGSDELIELVGKVFLRPEDEIVVSEHAFLRFKMAGDLMGCRVVSVPMRRFTHDLAAMSHAVTPRTKVLFVANPNNPTGTYVTAREVEALLAALPKSVLVVFDEAYYEYANSAKGYPDTIRLLKRGAPVMVLRTFSKVYGLAGLRIGYGFAHPEIIATLDRIRPPFNVSSAAQAAAVASLADRRQVTRGRELVTQQRHKLCEALTRRGIRVVPSAANFLMLDVTPRSGIGVFEAFLKRGIIVRAMEEYGFPHHIRVTIGLPAENRLFLKALDDILRLANNALRSEMSDAVPSQGRRATAYLTKERYAERA
ncbi:MAG: histidinol-phosphate transaminase [Elusimicrobia bacterium]|nr:histidinol-phosphate transaminase [Elusimicrobiota bacterium]